jgi:16S rRNA (uracil1498-N3)-methyltransferase
MRPRRFQVADVSGAIISVEGAEAIHALRVLRLKTGSQVILFNGTGSEVSGIIRSTGPEQFEVEVLERAESVAAGGPRLIIAVAAPKGERADWLVEKCAELGTSILAFVRCERGKVLPGEGKLERWRRKAVQAAKQARLARIMAVEAPRGISDILSNIPQGSRIWCADPDPANPTLIEALRQQSSAVALSSCEVVFVGPEGGFTENEVATIVQSGGQRMRLCGPILRVETAAIAAATLWAAWIAESNAS